MQNKKITLGEHIYNTYIDNKENPSLPLQSIATLQKIAEESIRPVIKINEANKSLVEDTTKIIERAKNNINSLSIVPSFSDMIPYIIKDKVQKVMIVGDETKKKTLNNYSVNRFPLPKGAKWEDLKITFKDGHTVAISYNNEKVSIFDYKQMGFENKKNHNPDTHWGLLREISENHGSLTNKKWNRKFTRNVKYETNEILKKFFKMETNPIPNYNKRDGYKPLFQILDEK